MPDLKSRMLPHWAVRGSFYDTELKRNVTYHELCPHTPLIFFNHYWDDVRSDPNWPEDKPLYLMPNIEMYELEAKHYWLADVILCRTRICKDYLTKWFDDNGNPREAKVIYTRFTSSDLAANARLALGNKALVSKNFKKPVFLHTSGNRCVLCSF